MRRNTFVPSLAPGLAKAFALLEFPALVVFGLALSACEQQPELVGVGAPAPPSFSVIGTETQITTDPAAQVYPAISGDRIVWQDRRNDRGDIYMYDLATGTESRITTDPHAQYNPAISGDRIVWEDMRNDQGDIYTYDLTTGTETRITTAPYAQGYPAISGDRIVWWDQGPDQPGIYMRDLTTDVQVRISTTGGMPAISGDRIVWQGDDGIYLYDLTTGMKTRITPAGRMWQYFPAISGERIVWLHIVGGNYEVLLYDLATGTESVIGTMFGPTDPTVHAIAISGDRVVWSDIRDLADNIDVYMYDLATGTDTRITDSPDDEWAPMISGDRIVWEKRYRDDAGANPDIYLFEFTTNPVTAIQAILEAMNGFEADGSIDNRGIAESLRAFLDQAEAAIARGNDEAAAHSLARFIAQVERLTSLHITEDAAQDLVNITQPVIDGLSL